MGRAGNTDAWPFPEAAFDAAGKLVLTKSLAAVPVGVAAAPDGCVEKEPFLIDEN